MGANIQVVNKYKHDPTSDDVYIGRGSPFGSPFSHLKSKFLDVTKCKDREEAVERYKKYLDATLTFNRNPELQSAISGLIAKHQQGEDINLVCFCKPKVCHGDAIKEYILNFKVV